MKFTIGTISSVNGELPLIAEFLIVAGGGVTIRSVDDKLALSSQYSSASLYKRGTDEWVLMGDLS